MKVIINLKKLFYAFIFLFAIISCIDPFDLKYDLNQSVIIVDAVLTDELDDQSIIIKQSVPNSTGTSSLIVGLENASVEIIVNETQKIKYRESAIDKGNYLAPAGFKAESNKAYQLSIITSLGQKFLSTVQNFTKSSPIKRVYQKLTIKGKPGEKNYQAFHNIYIDTDDPAGKGNNYLWTWRLFEAQEICRTCEPQERYYPAPYPGRCIKDLPSYLRNTIYDYQCNGNCWEIIHSLKYNVMNDDFSDGKTITARQIAEIPIYQSNSGALIEIKQQAINLDAYKYTKILIDQNQNSGGLADTPPVSLVGNITSVGGINETIAGFFRVVDESRELYWIDRSDTFGLDIKPLGLLGGRSTNLEPTGMDTTRPPVAPCINGYSRTNIRPIGWKDSE